KIITDSCCDLPEPILAEYDIKKTRLQVRFGDVCYQAEDLTNAEFYQKMAGSQVLPSTSQPTIEEMTRVYEEALADDSNVLAIHMSSGISGTFQGSILTQKMIDNDKLIVFDSRKASLGLGLMVIEAARMAANSEDIKVIIERMQQMQRKMECVFAVGNIEYLIKGGRISRTKGLVAEVLDIKPILRFNQEGKIEPYDKARGQKSCIRKLISIMEQQADNLENQTIGIVHASCPEIAEYIRNEIENRFTVKEIIVSEIGPVIGSHTGAGTFSVFFESK
ncbi:MAG: DegV family protein, partial [Syntrophomonadaceae bacterium]|nr:DegV family protein [Syntrophomonadaceae bacterium]